MISVIIPVYNVEKYILNCLRSISSQTFADFEVILVNDGSTDKSGKICDDFIKEDHRFKVFHKPNGGVSSARNVGLMNAQRDWILFVDADDTLPNDAFAYYVDVIKSNDVDMVLGGYVFYGEDDSIISKGTHEFEKRINMLECLKLFYTPDSKLFQGFIWNRLMKRSIIQLNGIQFDENIYYKEDGLFAVQYMLNCSGECLYTSKVLYNYYIHPSSSMRTYDSHFSLKYLTNLDARIKCLTSIRSVYQNKPLIRMAKLSIVSFYAQARKRINNTNYNNLKFRVWLLYRIVDSVGFFFMLECCISSIKRRIVDYYNIFR